MPYAPEPFPEVDGVELEHRFVDAAGLRVHVAVAGSGPPLVLLHGWPEHFWMWRHVLPGLVDRFTCYLPDLRGLGWTDAPEDPAGYRKTQLRDDLLATLDALGLQQVALAGHDWGAFTGYLACLHAPERFSAFQAFSIPPPFAFPPSALSFKLVRDLAYIPGLAAPIFGERFLRGGKHVGASIRARTAHPGAFDEADHYAALLRRPDRARASVHYYRQVLLHDAPSFGRSRPIEVPNHLVLGELDLANIPAALAPVSHEVVPGVGHFLPEEAPGVAVAAILDRLA